MTELSKNIQVPQKDKNYVAKSVSISDKCKFDFEKWLDNQNVAPYKVMFYDIPVMVQIAYLVEWFDTVGLIIYIKPKFHLGSLSFNGFIDGMEISKIETEYFQKRPQAFLKAIELANVFYNENFL